MHDKKRELSNFIKQFNQRIFIDALASIEGSIDLVWDGKKMMRQLNLVFIISLFLKNLGCKPQTFN